MRILAAVILFVLFVILAGSAKEPSTMEPFDVKPVVLIRGDKPKPSSMDDRRVLLYSEDGEGHCFATWQIDQIGKVELQPSRN